MTRSVSSPTQSGHFSPCLCIQLRENVRQAIIASFRQPQHLLKGRATLRDDSFRSPFVPGPLESARMGFGYKLTFVLSLFAPS